MAGSKSSWLRTSQNLLAWHDRQEKEAPKSLCQLVAGGFCMLLHLLRSACLRTSSPLKFVLLISLSLLEFPRPHWAISIH